MSADYKCCQFLSDRKACLSTVSSMNNIRNWVPDIHPPFGLEGGPLVITEKDWLNIHWGLKGSIEVQIPGNNPSSDGISFSLLDDFLSISAAMLRLRSVSRSPNAWTTGLTRVVTNKPLNCLERELTELI